MRIAVFDVHRFDREALELANVAFRHELVFFEARLTAQTAQLAAGFRAVCVFVNDKLDEAALVTLRSIGVELVALRCAGFNNVDLQTAAHLGMRVVRVPEYSPYAVAEHAVCLLLALNRRITRAHARVREWNFSLEGLVGFDLHGKTAGVIGTGRIGRAAIRILRGFGCEVLGYDVQPRADLEKEFGFRNVTLDELLRASDVITLHLPLTPSTQHLIDERALAMMRRGAFLINTSRGALIDSRALLEALKSGHIGAAGLDVYEEEEGVFFTDLSDKVLQDDVLARLLTFPNVLVTSHQAFLTREALANIAGVTLKNVSSYESGEVLENEALAADVVRPAQSPRTG